MKWEFIAAACLAFTTGCAILQNENAPRIAAVRAEGKVIVDGDASKLFWQDAPAYPLLVPEDQPGSPECAQKGWIRFARDDRFLYLYAEVVDDDVVQEENADYGNLYETGDVIELFLAPVGSCRYWEFLLAPNGRYAVLFFPGPGRKIFRTAMRREVRIEVAAKVRGTLNNWSDRDSGYTLEAAIPLAELTRFGDRFESDCWQLLTGRYNYSVTLPEIEYSATSLLPRTNFHLRKCYGTLFFPHHQ